MRSSMRVLRCLCIILAGILAAGSVMAAEINSGELGSWVWEGNGVNKAVDITIEETTDNSLWLTNSSGLRLTELINSSTETTSTTFNITGNATTGYYATIKGTTTEFALGNTDKFGLTFSDGVNYSSVYAINTVVNKANKYVLTSGNNMEISFFSTATPSAVPIPGSALLLGSSLLGLVGISSRRKKA